MSSSSEAILLGDAVFPAKSGPVISPVYIVYIAIEGGAAHWAKKLCTRLEFDEGRSSNVGGGKPPLSLRFHLPAQTAQAISSAAALRFELNLKQARASIDGHVSFTPIEVFARGVAAEVPAPELLGHAVAEDQLYLQVDRACLPVSSTVGYFPFALEVTVWDGEVQCFHARSPCFQTLAKLRKTTPFAEHEKLHSGKQTLAYAKVASKAPAQLALAGAVTAIEPLPAATASMAASTPPIAAPALPIEPSLSGLITVGAKRTRKARASQSPKAAVVPKLAAVKQMHSSPADVPAGRPSTDSARAVACHGLLCLSSSPAGPPTPSSSTQGADTPAAGANSASFLVATAGTAMEVLV